MSYRSAGLHPNLKRSRIAIYLQLAALFRSRIASGHWPVGSQIPRLEELAEEFKVARGTVRQAFDVLESEGLVERLRAKGSFVKKPPQHTRVHKLEMDWSSITAAHEGALITPIDNAVVDELPFVLQDFGIPVSRYRKLRRMHAREGEPYLLGTSYLDEQLYRALPAERFEHEPLLILLQEAAGAALGPARQVLTIATADVETANYLSIDVNSPIALMRRTVCSTSGELIYASEGHYRGDSVRLEVDLR